MGRIFRNTEFRSIVIKLLVLMAVIATLLCVLVIVQANVIQSKMLEQSSAIIGKALAAYPEIEDDIIGAVIVPATVEDVNRGRSALAASGYDSSAPISVDPILSSLFPGTLIVVMGIAALLAMAVLALTAHGYSRIYINIRRVSDAAEKVVDGDFSIQLPAGGEGDFEILGHRFNQMANRLRLNVEQLVAEKVFLKNTISDISHQLKTPLSTLVVYNDLMTEDENMDASQRHHFLVLGRQQLQRLEWLIQNLLKMARLEAGSIEFRKETVLLRDVAESSAAALGTMAGKAGVTVALHDNHADAQFTGDGAWLAEAVINILKNSIEHSKSGGTVDITLEQTPLTASISIADHGDGIGRADLPHIFERFYRSTSNIKPNSIGIGLAMSRAIVEGQGGSITVRSENGRGSEFTIVFLKTLGEGNKH